MPKLLIALISLSYFSCTSTREADLLIYNARIYTVDSAFSTAEAMAVKDGKIVAIGSTSELTSAYFSDNKINAEGKFIYPGLIDAHTHFYRYGLGLQRADLTGTKSWDEILDRLRIFANEHPDGWITGRGWDQNDWPVKEFPTKDKLDSLFPDRPVLLTRVDGHAVIANQKALEAGAVLPGMSIEGGSVETRNGKLTGILIDNATKLVTSRIPAATEEQVADALRKGQENCFAMGLTTVDDCGISWKEAMFMDSLQKKNLLKMRVYAMLSDGTENYNWLFKNGKLKTDRMNIRGFKVYADGALGSRGACLLEPYTDRPDWSGFLLSQANHFDSVASIIYQNDLQMCTHAIGDSGNRVLLDIYGKYLKGANDRRWRIEHAQVVNQADFEKFGRYDVIPSVQPTHATSDMYWAEKRLGPRRVKGAYAFKQLLDQNGWIPLGTDFPVEDISPFKTFYAAVFRIDDQEFPQGGFQMENALSRQEALRGMTIWAARSNFEEQEKGSLETGKLADFIILDRDLMSVPASEILKISVQATYIGGEKVYGKN